MSRKKDYHVVPRGKEWAVVRQGSERASSLHPRKSEAVSSGKNLAKAGKTDLYVHKQNGQIQNPNSYGSDPNPPKDTKH